MKKNILLYGLLLIGLIGFINTANAQQMPNTEFFLPGLTAAASPLLMSNISFAANKALTVDPNYYPTGYDKFGTFGKVVLGFGNMALGLGSLIAWEPLDSLKLLAFYGGSVVAGAGGYLLFSQAMPAFFSGQGLAIIVTFPIGLAIGATGLFLVISGVYTFIRTIVDGFLYPFRLGNPPSGNRSIKRPFQFQNLNMSFVPLPDGKVSSRLGYTMRF
jgi:hypothetical protein